MYAFFRKAQSFMSIFVRLSQKAIGFFYDMG